MPDYKIFPPIGVARLGRDDDFFISPETPGVGPIEQTTGAPVTRFKNADHKRIRKQAARFYLLESENGTDWSSVNLPEGAEIEWSVTLENKKSAINRPGSPPQTAQHPVLTPALAGQHIKPETETISGKNKTGPKMTGTFKQGSQEAEVVLGQLKTDDNSRLIVLGGNGASDSPNGTSLSGSYYNNPGWYDDVSDGPVKASIVLSDGSRIDAVGGAWVIVAPPNFAPPVNGIVTMYEKLTQLAMDHLGFSNDVSHPSYDLDIFPFIQRTQRYRWVHDDTNWSDEAFDSPNLGRVEAEFSQEREVIRDIILEMEGSFDEHVSGLPFKIRNFQKEILQHWVDGNFDTASSRFSNLPLASKLMRASLEGCIGQGLCPGIEAGIILTDPAIYASPFEYRIDHTKLNPGDLTALMAQPWQADFVKCHTDWWPTQRPDIAAQSSDFEDNENWIRGANSHQLMIDNFERLGFVVQEGNDEIFIEKERDPQL